MKLPRNGGVHQTTGRVQPTRTLGRARLGLPAFLVSVAGLLALAVVAAQAEPPPLANPKILASPPSTPAGKEVEDNPWERGKYQSQRDGVEGGAAADAQLEAIQAVDELRKNQARGTRTAGIATGSRVNPWRLTARTANLKRGALGWVSMGPDAGGRTRAIVISPKNPNHMLAANAAGGVWVSQDGGKRWEPADDFLANLSVSCLAMDPTNPDIVYAGTGEGFVPEEYLPPCRGGGIFRTTDGGKTWALLKGTDRFRYVTRVAVSADGKVVLAAVRGGREPEQKPIGGLYSSSDAAHATWTQRKQGFFGDVKFHPTDPTHAIAGSGLASAGPKGPAYDVNAGKTLFSEDGGTTWKDAVVTPVVKGWAGGRVEVAFAQLNPSIAFASVEVTKDGSEQPPPAVPKSAELWRSMDGGKTYQRMESKQVLTSKEAGKPPQTAHANWFAYANGQNPQGFYGNCLWAADAKLVIVGGINLWRSKDGGNTFDQISEQAVTNSRFGAAWQDPETSPHADNHAIVSHPKFDGKQNKTVFIGNDGGIFTTDDITTAGSDPVTEQDPLGHKKGWAALNGGYCALQFYGVGGAREANVIIGGAQDNGSWLCTWGDDGKPVWARILEGDGGFGAVDPRGEHGYMEAQFLALARLDAKQKAMITGEGRKQNKIVDRPDFIAPFILDPNDSNRLFACALQLWRTNNATEALDLEKPESGPSWKSIKAPDEKLGHISAIAVTPGEPDQIWVAHASGAIFHTTNGTADRPEWKGVDDKKPRHLPVRYCTRIVIDPSKHTRVYLTFGGYFHDNLWVTEDGGDTWRDLSASLPPKVKLPINTLAIHPSNPQYLYIGTHAGVWASEDGGRHWSVGNEGPANCRVDELIWMKEVLMAATFGRSIFWTDLTLPKP